MNLPVIRLATVDSTQAFLKRHPELGHCAVVADTQVEGRGRQGNHWESAPGTGLWMSAALPPVEIAPGLILQQAMCQVINILGSQLLGLKWPNDLVAHTDEGLVKVGGIIGEVSGGRLLVGLGINLTSSPDLPNRSIPASSLLALGVKHPLLPELALSILQLWMSPAKSAEPPFFWPREGDPVRWEEGQGVCLGWEPDGRLKVATDSGIERLSAGDVRGVRP